VNTKYGKKIKMYFKSVLNAIIGENE